MGGTSNHFPRSVLDSVGGWDPYNVTEDADLGVRLARAGWRVGLLASATLEDAPTTWRDWLAQRTRWQKGWLQTYFVHMRAPCQLWREVGTRAFCAYQIVLGGGLLCALVHPWFYVWLIWHLVDGKLWSPTMEPTPWLVWFAVGTIIAAYAATVTVALLALRVQRRVLHVGQALISPLYWLPVSLALYRALWEWNRQPHFWAKTPHLPR
jgi:glycosyltransferase XagB